MVYTAHPSHRPSPSSSFHHPIPPPQQSQVAIAITLAEPLELFPVGALTVDNGARIVRVIKPGSLRFARLFIVVIELPSAPGNALSPAVGIVLLEGALSWTGGVVNTRSNTFMIAVDDSIPAPVITKGRPLVDAQGRVQVTMLLDFGERVFEV